MRVWKIILIVSLLFNVLLSAALLVFVDRLGGVNYLLYRIKNRGLSALYEHRVTHFASLPIQQNTIVFLGDSITEACEWDELLRDDRVVNRGIGRDGTRRLLERLDPVLEPDPKQIFLMIGVNDLAYSTIANTLDGYKAVIEKILTEAPNTELILQSVLPINKNILKVNLENEDILAFNQAIADLAKSHQLKFVDLFPHFTDEAGNLDKKYTSDGIHLNGAAYLLWKSLIHPYLSNKTLDES